MRRRPSTALDLATGRPQRLGRAPGRRPGGLAAAGDRLYVAASPRGEAAVLGLAP